MATKETAIKEVNGFIALCRKNGLVFSKVILFGSAARGTADKYSDIDVMLFSDNFSENVIENRGKLTPYIRDYYNLDIYAYPSYYFEKGSLLIDEVKKDGLELTP